MPNRMPGLAPLGSVVPARQVESVAAKPLPYDNSALFHPFLRSRMATPLTVVIFGASGDLTSRKLVPALFNLYQKGRLPAETQVLGVSRTPFTDDAFRNHLA